MSLKNTALFRDYWGRGSTAILTAVVFGGLLLTSSFLQGACYVSPKGNDSNDGSKAKPFLSIQKGIDFVSDKKIAEKDRIVYLEDGFYYPSKTIYNNANSRGLVLTAAENARPVICGGKLVSDWKWEGKFLTASAQGVDFRFLAVNGVPAERTRLPEAGKYEHQSIFKTPWMSSSLGGWKVKPTQKELTTMIYQGKDLDAISDLENTEITLYHMWDETLLRVAQNDRKTKTITFSSQSAHPAGAFGVKTYVVWNSRHGMKRPGQWYLDRKADKIYYWPLAGQNEKNITAVIPVLNTLLYLNKTENIRIEKIGFTAAATPLIQGSFGASAFPGALAISQCKKVILDGISVSNVTGQGIKASGSEIKIINSHIRQTGAKGISIYGQNIRVENNKVHDIGLVYPSAIAVSCGSGPARKDQRAIDEKPEFGTSDSKAQFVIAHNEVYNAPYSGITCGGGYHVLIASNRIHDVMQKLADGAALYVGGGKYYTYRGNFVYDINSAKGYGSSAYYFDEQIDYSTIEGNLSINVGWPVHCHMVHNSIVKNNVFILDKPEDGILSFARNTDMELRNNVFVAGQGIQVRANGFDPTVTDMDKRKPGLVKIENNLFKTNGKIVYSQNWPGFKKSITIDTENQVSGINLGDPQIISDPRSGKIVFKNPKALEKFNIKPLDVSGAGLTSSVPEINF